MRKQQMLIGAACLATVGLGALASLAAPSPGPCAQIIEACREAGFEPGGARGGAGLMVDCVYPIVQGGLQPRRAVLPLPPISPRLITACRVLRPDFAQGSGLRFARPNGPRDLPFDGPYYGAPGFAPPAPDHPWRRSQRQAQSNPPAATGPDVSAGDRAPPPKTNAPSAASSGASASPPSASSAASGSPAPVNSSNRPNIVFVLTDDLSNDLLQFMPHVVQMQKDGVTFRNYFVTDSLCCPSRASIFSGRYPHDTGIFTNKGRDGGYRAFRDWGEERATFATALSAVGYRTQLLGKYLNGYRPIHPSAPGWASWAVAGNGYREFNYSLNQDGKIVPYGSAPSDYLTDVVSNLATRFIKDSGDSPFLVEVATFAPHRPSTPAPRDADALPGLRAPRSPAFNAVPDANTVNWLRRLPGLSDAEMASIDAEYRRRAQSVLAVDKMIGELQAAVAAIGKENNTYFVFSSDNGYHMGEHRLLPGKMTAYETDIRVPLIVTGPGIAPGATIDEITQNIDLCPTFAELAAAAAPASIDGRSLVPLLKGQKPTDWRTLALVEHHGPIAWSWADPDAMDLVDEPPYRSPNRRPWQRGQRHGNAPTYEAIRGPSWVYVEYAEGEKEYHDLATDADELRNTFPSLSAGEKASLHAALQAVVNCHDAQSCQAAERASRSAAQK